MTGVELIARERQRQIDKGWTRSHDDQHIGEELLAAAFEYLHRGYHFGQENLVLPQWPFREPKPTSKEPIENLMKAGALIAAEIDRQQALDRLEGIEFIPRD